MQSSSRFEVVKNSRNALVLSLAPLINQGMKMLLPVHFHSHKRRSFAPFAGIYSAVCLVALDLLLLGSTAFGLTNHPPTVSFIESQRNQTGVFEKKFFRILEYDPGDTFTPQTISLNPAFYSASDIEVRPARKQRKLRGVPKSAVMQSFFTT